MTAYGRTDEEKKEKVKKLADVHWAAAYTINLRATRSRGRKTLRVLKLRAVAGRVLVAGQEGRWLSLHGRS